MYKLFRPLLFLLEAETAHNFFIKMGAFFSNSFFRIIFSWIYDFQDSRLESTVAGIKFKNPVGLAAGFDKNSRIANFLSALGFGFVEIGTVTPLPQYGNEKPRLFRLIEDWAIINRMGFNGVGAKAVRENLKNNPKNILLGINLGKNKITPNERASEDYRKAYKELAEFADYLVVNVSSPNTAGIRELQDKEPLMNLLGTLEKTKPIFLKIAPDLTDGQLDDIVEIVSQTKIAGVIATNTTVQRTNLKSNKSEQQGGLSGKPLAVRSTEVIRYIYKKSSGSFPIIGVGGIFSAQDAYEKIRAGASLIQIYTGLVYEGPGLVKKINQGLVKLLERDGFKNVADAVGVEAK